MEQAQPMTDYPARIWIDFSGDRQRPVLRHDLDWPLRRDDQAIAEREARLEAARTRPSVVVRRFQRCGSVPR